MSVRIHAIAKETSKTSKEVIEILVERGYDVKSASSTIDNITAQSLIEEFRQESSVPSDSADPEIEDTSSAEEKPKDIPFVKTKQDLDREREEKEKAQQAEKDALLASQAAMQKESISTVEPTVPEVAEKTAGAAPSLPPLRLKVRVPLLRLRSNLRSKHLPAPQHLLRMNLRAL